MPDVDRLVERVIEAVMGLTQQVSRLAFAAEALTIMQVTDPQIKKCRACMSRIQRHDAKQCLACGEFMGDG